MSNESSKPEPAVFTPPVSVFSGPIAELVGHRLLSPPARPGLLASLARYEIVRVLGGGGMGVVLLGRDTESGADVAIKMIRPELASNQQVVHRFVKEAGHLQKLKHPNVVPVLELADREQGPYFVMPYFERGSVAHRIKPGEPMPAEMVLEVALEVARALSFAHRRGIIHRDLKPANILLDKSGHASLADFGLARTLFNDTIVDVEHDQFEGTAPYMSPGVAAGNAEDTRCDIYAFGALLYEMLTGEAPFAGRTTNEIRKQILAGPPRPLLERNPRADSGLAAVAEGAMARELRDRYADMADVVADLERIQAGRSPEGPHGLARRVRQNPRAMWITATVILFGFLIWMMWPAAAPKPSPPAATNSKPAPIVAVPTPTPIISGPPVAMNTGNSPVVAGAVGEAGSGDGFGSQARFRSPWGLAVDATGTIYVADTGNRTIRKITPDGNVTTIAGAPGRSGSVDGPGLEARFMAPISVAVSPAGDIYVADLAGDTIRKIAPDGLVSTFAGLSGVAGNEDGRGYNAHFRNPLSIAVDSHGTLYVADQSNWRVRKISPLADVTTLPQRFSDPHGVAVDSAGNVYVADTGTNALWKITPSGKASRFGGILFNPQSVAVDSSGMVYATDSAGIHRISAGGAAMLLPPLRLGSAPDSPNAYPAAIAAGPKGTIYIADNVNNVICRLPR